MLLQNLPLNHFDGSCQFVQPSKTKLNCFNEVRDVVNLRSQFEARTTEKTKFVII